MTQQIHPLYENGSVDLAVSVLSMLADEGKERLMYKKLADHCGVTYGTVGDREFYAAINASPRIAKISLPGGGIAYSLA